MTLRATKSAFDAAEQPASVMEDLPSAFGHAGSECETPDRVADGPSNGKGRGWPQTNTNRSCVRIGLPPRPTLRVLLLLLCTGVAGVWWQNHITISTHPHHLLDHTHSSVIITDARPGGQGGRAGHRSLQPGSKNALADDARVTQDDDEDWLHAPNPPRIRARSMREFRHLRFLNENFVKWADTNLTPLPYDEEVGMFSFRWSEVPDPVPAGENEIVLLTQSSISRLQSFRSMSTEWGGPVSLSVFIPFQMGTTAGTRCRTLIRDFMRNHTKAPNAAPLIVSVLYTNSPVENAHCNIDAGTRIPKGKENKAARAQFLARGRTAGALVERRRRLQAAPASRHDAAHMLHAAGVSSLDARDAQHAQDAAVQAHSAAWAAHSARHVQNGESDIHDAASGAHDAVHDAGRDAGREDVYGTRHLLEARTRSAVRRKAMQQAVETSRRLLMSRAHFHAGGSGGPRQGGVAAGPQAILRPTPEDYANAPAFRDLYNAMYPVNRLRNLAWSQVPKKGAFVFLLDVDFVPSPDLYHDLKAGKWASKLQEMRRKYEDSGKREALIVPAFERTRAPYTGDCRAEADCEFINGKETPRSRERMRAMYEDRSVDIFHAAKFQAGHSCYPGQYWLENQKDDELVSFTYKHPCEPYAIGLSDAMPRYDERFRGRGMNKVEQLTHMGMWGFTWQVLPRHFALHLPHPSEGDKPIGGWDRIVVPLVLMKQKILDIEKEPEFRQHIDQEVPAAS